MAPKAKKILMVLLPVYVIVLALFIYGLATKEEAKDKAPVVKALEEALSEQGKSIPKSRVEEIYDQFIAEKGGIISVQLYTIMMQMLNFAVLLALLYGFVWEPLVKFLDSRRDDIRNDIEGARTSREEAKEALTLAREEATGARHERTELRERAQKRADAERKEILAEARLDAEKLIEAAKRETAAEIDEAYSDLRKKLGELAVAAAGKILEREIREEDHERLVQEFIQQIEEQQLAR